MYHSQYYTCEQIDERLLQGYLDDYNTQTGQSLTKAQFLTKLGSIFSKEGVIDNTATQIGYYECDTAAGTAAKAITVANYALFAGGSMKVKFANKNTANNATLNINSQGAKALYYQGERASATNSWDAEEVVEIYYDGTSYYANNVKGGSGSGVYDVSKEHPTSGPNSDGKFTLEYILNSSNVNELIPVNKRYPGMTIQFVSTSDNKYVQYRLMSDTFNTTPANWQGVDDEPTAGSDNLVKSGSVKKFYDFLFYNINNNILYWNELNRYEVWPRGSDIPELEFGNGYFSKLLPVKAGDVINIKSQSNCYFYVLKTLNLPTQTTTIVRADSSDSFHNRITVNSSNPWSATIPDDAHFLLITDSSNGGSVYYPESIEKNGIELMVSLQEENIYDVSKANAVGGVYARYSTLSKALNAVAVSARKGGMMIKYIDEDSQEYVQYRLMATSWSNIVGDWQGVDKEPVVESRNLIESGAVAIIKQDVNIIKQDVSGNPNTDYTSELQFGSIASTGIGNVNPLTIVPSNTWKYAIIPVVAGQQYKLKLRGGSSYPACILLDKNNITIAEYALIAYTTQAVTIPDGVTTMAINDDPSQGTPSIIRLASKGLHGFIEIVENKADSVLPWNNMDVYQGWIMGDGTFKENNGLIKLIPVTPNSTITFKRSATANAYLFVLKSFNPDTYFYDNADCVESYPQRLLVTNDISLLIPADARYIAITYYDITRNKYCYPDAIFVDGIDITLVYKSCMAWDDLFEYSGYISYNNIFEQDTARFKLIPVKGGDKLYFQQNTTVNSYYFMLRGFDELRYIQYPPYFSQNNNERLQVVTGMIVVPDDVKYIAITNKNSSGVDNSPYMIAINGVDIKQSEKFPIDIVSLNADKDSVISSSSAFMGVQGVSGQKTRHKYLTLLHGSDYHADVYNFIRTMDFAAHYNKDIDAVIISGDLMLNTFEEDNYEKLYANHYQEAGCPVLPVIGNHELGYGEDNAKFIYHYNGMSNSVDDCAARFITPYMTYNGCVQGGNGGGYYYKDFSEYKVRVITICEYEMPRILEQGTENIAKYAFWFRYISQTQVNWLVTTLNSVQEDWFVIVVMHQPIDTITKYVNPFSSPYIDGGWSAQGKIIQDVIDAYIEKTSINNTYTNTKGYDTTEVPNVTVNADFSNAKGTFICYLCGHAHFDMVGQSSLATNKQVCVVMNTSGTTRAYYDDLYRCMYKQSQDCLNMLVFDTDKKQIRIIRIGANTTLDMKERKMTCIPYSQE